MKIWITLEVDASECDWSESDISYAPCAQHVPGGWDGDVVASYFGTPVINMDYDKAWDYLIEGEYANK